MAEHHRKVELQSPDDLQYLISNVRRAAHEKIDKDLPPIEGEDKMRERVEELVHEYITKVFVTSGENLTINGLDPSPELLKSMLTSSTAEGRSIEEHEPFNAKLWERAKDWARQEEDLIEEIAMLRRTIPSISVDGLKKSYKQGMESDETEILRREEVIKNRDAGTAEMMVGRLERQADVEANWKKGVDGLGRLRRTLPEMVAKKERADRAEDYVRTSVRN